MSSPVSSANGNPTLVDLVASHWQKLSRLKVWAGTLAMQSLQRAAVDNAKNQEAESAHVRRSVWDAADATEGGDVNDTVLGDMTTTHIHHAPPSSLGKILLGAGLLATGIGIPAGAWMIASGAKEATTKPSDPPAFSVPVEKPSERPAVTIGGYELRLGK